MPLPCRSMRLALPLSILTLTVLLLASVDCRSSRARGTSSSGTSSGSKHGIGHRTSNGHQRRRDDSSEDISHRERKKDHSGFLEHERDGSRRPGWHSGRSNRTVINKVNVTRDNSHPSHLPNLRNSTFRHYHNRTNLHAGDLSRKNTTAGNHHVYFNKTRTLTNTTMQHNKHGNTSKHDLGTFPTRNELISNSTTDKILGKPTYIQNANQSFILLNILKAHHNKTDIKHNGIVYNKTFTSVANPGIYTNQHNNTQYQFHRNITNNTLNSFADKQSNTGFQNISKLHSFRNGSKGNDQSVIHSSNPINNSWINVAPPASVSQNKTTGNANNNSGSFIGKKKKVFLQNLPPQPVLSSNFYPPSQLMWANNPPYNQPSFNYYENHGSGFQNFHKKKDKKKKKKFKFDVSLEDFSLEDLGIDKDKITDILKDSAKNFDDKLKVLHKKKLIPKLPTRRLYASSFPQVQQELNFESSSSKGNSQNFSKKMSTIHYNRTTFGVQSPVFAGLESVQTSINNISRQKRELSPKGKATVKIINDFFKHERDCNDTILDARRRRSIENLDTKNSGLDLRSISLGGERNLITRGKNIAKILKTTLINERDNNNDEFRGRKWRNSHYDTTAGKDKKELDIPKLTIIREYKFGKAGLNDIDFSGTLPKSKDGEIIQSEKILFERKARRSKSIPRSDSELTRSGKELNNNFVKKVSGNSKHVAEKKEILIDEMNGPISHSQILHPRHKILSSKRKFFPFSYSPIFSFLISKNMTKLKETNESLAKFFDKNESLASFGVSPMEDKTNLKKRSINESEIYNILITNDAHNLTSLLNVSKDPMSISNDKKSSSIDSSNHNDIYGHFNSVKPEGNLTSAGVSLSLLNESKTEFSTNIDKTGGVNIEISSRSIQGKRDNIFNKSEKPIQNTINFPVTSNITSKSESSEILKPDNQVKHSVVDDIIPVTEGINSNAFKGGKVGLDIHTDENKSIDNEFNLKITSNLFDQSRELMTSKSLEATTMPRGVIFVHFSKTDTTGRKPQQNSNENQSLFGKSDRSSNNLQMSGITDSFLNERAHNEQLRTTLLFGRLKILGVERKVFTGTTPLPLFVLPPYIPRQDTVLIQAPYRRTSCPSGYKLARGICREVWGW